MRGMRVVECVSSDAIVRPTSVPTVRFPEAVASAKGKMPTLNALSPSGGGGATVCPAARLATVRTMRTRTVMMLLLEMSLRTLPLLTNELDAPVLAD
jgi:hypothetical protein